MEQGLWLETNLVVILSSWISVGFVGQGKPDSRKMFLDFGSSFVGQLDLETNVQTAFSSSSLCVL